MNIEILNKSIIITIMIIVSAIVLPVYAQQTEISGKITSKSDGVPITGVYIEIKNSNLGAQSDAEGIYKINANKGDTLEFSFVGFKTVSLLVGDNQVINVSMENSTLDEVVVTALGIKASKKSLTYAAQEIKAEELTDVRDSNIGNNLSGKISGLVVNRSASGAGGSVKITIRGNSSMSNNQPLYVIDGVPMQNSVGSQPDKAFGSLNGGNRDSGDAISLLNPDDIESMTVLKGASASALYGSEGANGVILITTKSGEQGKSSLKISSYTTFDTAAFLPEFQNKYTAAVGTDGAVNEKSWGPEGSFKNPIDDFYKTGITQVSSVSFIAGSKIAQTYLSYSNTISSGIMPTNEMSRHNLTFKETAKFFDNKVTVNASVNLSKQDIENRPVNGLYFNPLTGLYLFPRGQDFNKYENEYEKVIPETLLLEQQWPLATRDIIQNPYWILNRNKNTHSNQRALTNLSISYKPIDWLELRSRLSYDVFLRDYKLKLYDGTQATLSPTGGRYIVEKEKDTQLYADIIGLINKDLNDNFDVSITVGMSTKHSITGDKQVLDSGVQGGLKYANWFNVANFVSTGGIIEQLTSNRKVNSLFGNVKFGYNKYLYLDISGRNDWSSTLVNTNNPSFFYPSFGLTGIINEMVELPRIIDFAKIRLSYAIVGNDLPAFITNPKNTIVGGNVTGPEEGPRPGVLLKPELQKSFELGLDINLFVNRIGLAFTYYNTNTENQYVTIPAPSTNPFGYKRYAFNAGEIQNTGYEISINGMPIKNNDFSWNIILNFAKNNNIVNSLPEELKGGTYLTTVGVNSYAYKLEEGQSFGLIQGKKIKKDAQGRPILDADEKLVKEDNLTTVGNANPDFTLGLINQFKYKNYGLKFHIDGKFGGHIMSFTQALMDEYGVSKNTGDARDAGGVTVNAVKADGTPITKLFTAEEYYASVGGRAGATAEYTYSATNINLREVSLSYTYNFSNEKFIKSTSFSIVGRNLLFLYKDAPFDPNIFASTGEGLQGVDLVGNTSVRSIGFNINFKF